MTTNFKSQVFSDLAIHPGETLEEEIEFIGMTQQELAKRMGRPPQVVNEIIRGKKSITRDTAVELEKVLDIPAYFWMNLQTHYELTLARLKEREALLSQQESLKHFPVSAMEKLGWIEKHRDKSDKVRSLLQFLGFASFDAWRDNWHQPLVGFRISENSKVSPGALSVWLKQGELKGRTVEVAEYEEEEFRYAIAQIRGMTSEVPEAFVPRMQKLCADAGVAVVFIPELPKSGANGAARWLTPQKGLIQMSLKWRWHDIFWFSFFHECYHILKHKVRQVQVDGLNGHSEEEDEANRFTGDLLIPPKEWHQFVASGYKDETAVETFAKRIAIHPGIVVGRMQHEGLIPYNRLTHLKTRFAWKQVPV